jgi:hypothetical protein
VKFGLQFEPKNQPAESQPREDAAAKPVELPKALPKSKSEAPAEAEAEAAVNSADDSAGDKASTVIALDAFRKKH